MYKCNTNNKGRGGFLAVHTNLLLAAFAASLAANVDSRYYTACSACMFCCASDEGIMMQPATDAASGTVGLSAMYYTQCGGQMYNAQKG